MQALIVDDHALFGEGLRLLLLGGTPVQTAVCCKSGTEALALAERTPFDLVLADWNLGTEPGGETLVAALKERLPHSRVVVVSGESGSAVVRRAVEAGAAGFVPKESSPALLIDALSVTAHGGIYLPAAVLLGAGAEVVSAPATAPAVPPATAATPAQNLRRLADVFPQLTPRHAEVLDYVARGMSNKQIARALDIADGTVKQHLNAIFRELDVSNRTEAVYLMAKSGVRFE